MNEEEMLNDIERRFNAGLPLSYKDISVLMEALHKLVDILVENNTLIEAQDKALKTVNTTLLRQDKTITQQSQVIDTLSRQFIEPFAHKTTN